MFDKLKRWISPKPEYRSYTLWKEVASSCAQCMLDRKYVAHLGIVQTRELHAGDLILYESRTYKVTSVFSRPKDLGNGYHAVLRELPFTGETVKYAL